MRNENPIHQAWAIVKGYLVPPTITDPVVLVKELIHNNQLCPEEIGEELFGECLDEILRSGLDIYPREIVEFASEQRIITTSASRIFPLANSVPVQI